ncbi:MAG TPA: hypothetical protein VGH84_01150 [Steroidobacteraceae bacterium]
MQDKEFAVGYMNAEKLGNAIFEFMGITDPGAATKAQRLVWLRAYVACITAIEGPAIAEAFGGEITPKKLLAAHKDAKRFGLTQRRAPNAG